MKKRLQAIWNLLVAVLFPSFCLGCRREGSFLCDDCFGQIPRTVVPEGFLARGVDGCPSLDGVLACAEYEHGTLLPRLIHSFKYEFVTELAEPLGRLMAEILARMDCADAALCPVPLHKKRLRWRGFNQAALLASAAGSFCNIPVAHFLRRQHFAKPQMELGREERLMNVRGAFTLEVNGADGARSFGSFPRAIFLVDDVATTGSTLEACASVLKAAGAQKVYGIVLARVH